MSSPIRIRAITALALLGLLSIFALAACGSSDSDDASASSSDGGLTKIRFVTGWVTPDFEDIPVTVAQQMGYYKDAGLDVQVIYPPSTTTSPKLLAAKSADLGYVSTSDLLSTVQQGVPVKAIAGVWQRPSNALVAKPGVTIDPKDFSGKTFAVFAGAENKALLNLFLKAGDVTTSDVKVVTASSDNLQLVLAGKVDYAINASPYAAAEIRSATGKDPGLLPVSALNASQTYAQTAYAGNTAWMSSHASEVRAWLAATMKGAQWAIDHPEEAVKMFVAAAGKDGGDVAYNTAGWDGVIPLIKGNGPLFAMDDAQWKSLETFLSDGGAISGTMPAMSDLYTNEYLSK